MLALAQPVLAAPPAAQAEVQAQFVSGIAAEEYLTTSSGVMLLKRVLTSHRMAEIEQAAASGNAEARYLLGVAFYQGVGLPRKPENARDLLRQSAMAGFPRAKHVYGQMLYAGDGGRKDVDEALGWMEQASAAGVASASFELGRHYRYLAPEDRRDPAKAHDWFAKAADRGLVDGKAELVMESYRGIGRPADPAAALAEFELLAQQGSYLANSQLGEEYRYGAHVGKDPARALGYYRKAAAQGYSVAVAAAAEMLSLGETGKPDPQAAIALLIEQAGTTDWPARALLAKLLIETGTKPPAGIEVEQLAFETLDHGAIIGFGTLMMSYREGKHGYAKDLAKAGALARRGLKVMEKLDLSEEGAWPLHAQGAAYTILQAIAQRAVTPEPGEVTALENRYGAPGQMKKFTATVQCSNGLKAPSEFYVWEVFGEKSPLEDQFTWLEKARLCKVSETDKARFERLFNKSRATGKAFQDLVVADLQNPASVAPMAPIEF